MSFAEWEKCVVFLNIFLLAALVYFEIDKLIHDAWTRP
jgi:hypothetical protein